MKPKRKPINQDSRSLEKDVNIDKHIKEEIAKEFINHKIKKSK